MKNLLRLSLLVFINFSGYTQTEPLTKFDSLKARAQLTIGIPEGCHELDIPFLHKIPHQFAIGPADSSFQVRYWIRPLDTWVVDYNKKSKKEKKESMAPNDLCKSMMMLAVLDASNNKSQDFNASQYPEMTKKAYNADWDASTMIETGWPQVGYKYCYIWCLHKDDVGDLFIYGLANNPNDFFKVIGKVAKEVRFE